MKNKKKISPNFQSQLNDNNYQNDEFDRKQLLLNEIKVSRDQYQRLLVEFLYEFVLEGKPLQESYLVEYEELLEITKGEEPPSSLSFFEYMVFCEDDFFDDQSYKNLH
jgi:hypothetical protein